LALALSIHNKLKHREVSALSNEIPEESDQLRFLRAACFANIKGSVGLILAKASAMRISIPFCLILGSGLRGAACAVGKERVHGWTCLRHGDFIVYYKG